MYNVVCYKDGRRYCVINDKPMTLEAAIALADKENSPKAISCGWTYYTEKA